MYIIICVEKCKQNTKWEMYENFLKPWPIDNFLFFFFFACFLQRNYE